ncbi:MAG: DUF1206 domain-containing protein [Acidimicrobiales bacterium]
MTRTFPTTEGSRAPGRGGWKETLGRVGLVGQGVVYAIVGFLALQLASGDASGEDADQNGAIEWLAAQPLGRFLLVALTIALVALAVWRSLDALKGDPVEGSEATDRVKYASLAVVYAALAWAALAATIANWSGSGDGGSDESGGDNEQQAAGVVLEWPGGRWIVMAVGLAVIGYAIYAVKKYVVDQAFLERLDVGSDHWMGRLGRAGYAARSVITGIVGFFFVQAGLTYDPEEAQGMSAALQELAGEGWGQWVLWAVALGLLALGAFTVAEAKHRRAA